MAYLEKPKDLIVDCVNLSQTSADITTHYSQSCLKYPGL